MNEETYFLNIFYFRPEFLSEKQLALPDAKILETMNYI